MRDLVFRNRQHIYARVFQDFHEILTGINLDLTELLTRFFQEDVHRITPLRCHNHDSAFFVSQCGKGANKMIVEVLEKEAIKVI
jgi:hypothetical protein